MTENFIIVENANDKDLENILMDFANLYADSEFVNGIQFYRKKKSFDSFLILFTHQPDFERFNYFVNYIRYPANYKKFSPFLRGFYKTSDITQKSEFNTGEWIMVYVSKHDKEYDNVCLVNNKNENYLYDFGGKIKKLKSAEEMFKLMVFDKNNYHHILDIIPSTIPDNGEFPKPLIGQKIKDVFAIIISLAFTVLGFFSFKDSKDIAIPTIIFFGIGFIVLLWKFMNPKKFEKLKNRKNKNVR